LNTLASHQQPLSVAFSGLTGLSADERFGLGEWDVLSTGAPTLKGALAVFDCELIDTKDLATHRVLFGKVTGLRMGDNLRPLIYHARDYHVLESGAEAATERE
jgi:cob(II)yrinic acid a,c-diamide reductase